MFLIMHTYIYHFTITNLHTPKLAGVNAQHVCCSYLKPIDTSPHLFFDATRQYLGSVKSM